MTDQPEARSSPLGSLEPTDHDRARRVLGRAIEELSRELDVPMYTRVTDRLGRKVPRPMEAMRLADEMAAAARFLQRHEYIPLARAAASPGARSASAWAWSTRAMPKSQRPPTTSPPSRVTGTATAPGSRSAGSARHASN